MGLPTRTEIRPFRENPTVRLLYTPLFLSVPKLEPGDSIVYLETPGEMLIKTEFWRTDQRIMPQGYRQESPDPETKKAFYRACERKYGCIHEFKDDCRKLANKYGLRVVQLVDASNGVNIRWVAMVG